MKPPHPNCGNDCIHCVFYRYRVGLVDDERDDDFDESAPESPPPNHIVPDSLDPDDLGTVVEETEFDDGSVCMPKSPENVGLSKLPETPEKTSLLEVGGGSGESESPCTKYVKRYLKRMGDKRPKTPEKTTEYVEKAVVDPPSPMTVKFNAFVARQLSKR
ncbi:uncharacterized protein LOC141649889 [Silene latifolia]|uniref:uncharacterized protein LOC141649889 n=1 Tax=Silene latifolia TaxID=37657 RepID=UPI003D7723CE